MGLGGHKWLCPNCHLFCKTLGSFSFGSEYQMNITRLDRNKSLPRKSKNQHGQPEGRKVVGEQP